MKVGEIYAYMGEVVEILGNKGGDPLLIAPFYSRGRPILGRPSSLTPLPDFEGTEDEIRIAREMFAKLIAIEMYYNLIKNSKV